MAAPDKPSQKPGSEPAPSAPAQWRSILWVAMLCLFLVWLYQDFYSAINVRTIPYSEFKAYVAEKVISQCEVRETEIFGTIERSKVDNASTLSSAVTSETAESESTPESTDIKSDPETFLFRTVRVEDPKLVEDLETAGIEFVGVQPDFLPTLLAYWLLPIGLLMLFWIFMSRRLTSVGQGVMSMGRSHAKLVADKDTGVTFADVAGCDEAKYELQEVVDFLQNPEKYTKLGAKIPKGVLLVGPPGTGKTLLARAVAGQARVPFFSLSGSEFVEMFVGVGAARVRDLFQQATSHAPCIVFIDELDAVGRQRGIHVGTTNDEREQTLNQLLVEMDGFDANVGVILLAATNRPDVLDRALLRPGRFDRQVVLDSPDVQGREAILAVHSRNKPLDNEVDLHKVAQATPGFSGADLANVMNESALLSARHESKTISQKDIESAVERVVAGPERKSRRLEPHEKERVAYHEVGHAIVGAYSEHADPVHKISIVPRGKAALGYTLQLPIGEHFLMTRRELFDRLKGLLGGRASEEVKYGEISSGAENDLRQATAMAREMVCMYGMSEEVGLVHCARRESMILPDVAEVGTLDCSQSTADKIDLAVKELLDKAYQDAKKILSDHRDELDRVAAELLIKETLDAAAFNALLDRNRSS